MRVESSEGRVRMSFIDACFGDPEIDERIKLSVEVTMEADWEDYVSCSVDIDTGIQMPSPISSAPRPLLNSIASLVAKIILRSILPNFLESLRKDFQQWQRGKTLEQRWAVARDSKLMASAVPVPEPEPLPPTAGSELPPPPQGEGGTMPAGDADSPVEPLSISE
mgnify:CR=1 FL=1